MKLNSVPRVFEMKFVKESALILLSFVVVFVWQQTILADYTIHALVLLTLSYLILTARKKEFSLIDKTGDSLSITILMTMILLLVFSTGGLTSTLFFLLYFLAFGITFAFEPATVFIFLIAVALIFFPNLFNDDVVSNFLHIGVLLIISPIAFIFGRQIKKDLKNEIKIDSKKKKRLRSKK